MTATSWTMMLVITMNAMLFHAMPRFRRPDILFAVTVPEAFVVGDGRGLVFRYRRSSGSARRQRSRSACCFPRLSRAPDWQQF